MLCQYGYFFPVNDSKTLTLKDDSSLYRFQVRYIRIIYVTISQIINIIVFFFFLFVIVMFKNYTKFPTYACVVDSVLLAVFAKKS